MDRRIGELEKELGLEDALAAEGSRIRARLENRRYGKAVTMLEGFDARVDLDALAKELKHRLGTGGTVKERTVELQGDHRKGALAHLQRKGFRTVG